MSVKLALGALLLALLALAAWLRARHLHRRSGLPSGQLLSTDTGTWRRPERPLFSVCYRLTGRPDYLIREGGQVVPVEVKSGPCPSAPYLSHRLQLAAYCLLVEDEYGQAPPYGLIKYRDGIFTVDYTPQLRSQLLATLAEMHSLLNADDLPPNHASPNRCRRCGYRTRCGRSLA